MKQTLNHLNAFLFTYDLISKKKKKYGNQTEFISLFNQVTLTFTITVFKAIVTRFTHFTQSHHSRGHFLPHRQLIYSDFSL